MSELGDKSKWLTGCDATFGVWLEMSLDLSQTMQVKPGPVAFRQYLTAEQAREMAAALIKQAEESERIHR